MHRTLRIDSQELYLTRLRALSVGEFDLGEFVGKISLDGDELRDGPPLEPTVTLSSVWNLQIKESGSSRANFEADPFMEPSISLSTLLSMFNSLEHVSLVSLSQVTQRAWLRDLARSPAVRTLKSLGLSFFRGGSGDAANPALVSYLRVVLPRMESVRIELSPPLMSAVTREVLPLCSDLVSLTARVYDYDWVPLFLATNASHNLRHLYPIGTNFVSVRSLTLEEYAGVIQGHPSLRRIVVSEWEGKTEERMFELLLTNHCLTSIHLSVSSDLSRVVWILKQASKARLRYALEVYHTEEFDCLSFLKARPSLLRYPSWNRARALIGLCDSKDVDALVAVLGDPVSCVVGNVELRVHSPDVDLTRVLTAIVGCPGVSGIGISLNQRYPLTSILPGAQYLKELHNFSDSMFSGFQLDVLQALTENVVIERISHEVRDSSNALNLREWIGRRNFAICVRFCRKWLFWWMSDTVYLPLFDSAVLVDVLSFAGLDWSEPERDRFEQRAVKTVADLLEENKRRQEEIDMF